MSTSSTQTSKRHILAATTTCYLGFDPWVAYQDFQRAGIRYVEVLAFPAAMGINVGLTTFAPESMDARDVARLRERLQDMGLTPLTVGAFCDPLDLPQAEAFKRRIDFARQLRAPFVMGDVSPDAEVGERRRKLVDALRWFGDYAAERSVRIALETHEG